MLSCFDFFLGGGGGESPRLGRKTYSLSGGEDEDRLQGPT